MSPESDPESAQSLEDFTRIVLSNVMGKPVKAVVSRDDVSGVLKVVMTGVDPTVFEPSVSLFLTVFRKNKDFDNWATRCAQSCKSLCR